MLEGNKIAIYTRKFFLEHHKKQDSAKLFSAKQMSAIEPQMVCRFGEAEV